MEIRVLRYFLAVAREQSFSLAAETLYLSQPTLSRQLRELEEELGKKLLVRSSKGVTLTEEGMMLRKRAEELVELMDKTEQEIRDSSENMAGKVCIGAGETYAVKLIADTARRLQEEYPDIKYSIYSADGADVLEKLDKGLLDFGLVFREVDAAKYEQVEIPLRDTWGVLMRRDSLLAAKEKITFDELKTLPLILPRQANHNLLLTDRIGVSENELNIAAQYNLVYNASVMVSEGMGYALTFDKLINVSGDSKLCFRPLEPRFEAECRFVWKRYPVFSKAAGKFLEYFKEYMEDNSSET